MDEIAETKSDRFKRLASKRTENILNALRILGNCANRSAYEYTQEDTRKIFAAIERQVADTKARFRDSSSLEFRL